MQAPPLPPDSSSCKNKRPFSRTTPADCDYCYYCCRTQSKGCINNYWLLMNHKADLWIVQETVRGKWSRLSTWLRYCLLGGLMVHRELLLPCSSANVTSSWPYASRNCKALWEIQKTKVTEINLQGAATILQWLFVIVVAGYSKGEEPASFYQKVAGSIPLDFISKCPWARYWTSKLLLMCWSPLCMAATAISVWMSSTVLKF